ncbi:hypothetical protein EGW08_009246 [Elysia chlorotica]|uniref:Uncharacterized protein n=1 Tax=Elysia chlorotica TaxID=188477 RepID=A0A3S0ZUD4_ELYCH|nr:hypothetical protein EGW08_009246 [Elysia chlorotica]
MWSDKEAEIELRDAGMRRLHSESHLLDDGKSDFIPKLEKRPYTAEIKELQDDKDDSKFGNTVLDTAPTQSARSHTVPFMSKQDIVGKEATKETQKDNASQNPLIRKPSSEHKAIIETKSKTNSESVLKHDKPPHSETIVAGTDTELLIQTIEGKECQVTEGNAKTNGTEMCSNDNVAPAIDFDEPTRSPKIALNPSKSTLLAQNSPDTLKDKETSTSCIDTDQDVSIEESHVKMETSEQETPDAPARPRNPRNRIRPGQSSFFGTDKPVVAKEKPPVPSDTPAATDISPEKSNSHAKNQGSFMKTCLTTDEQKNTSTNAKSEGKLSSKTAESERVSNPTNRMHQKRRSIQLRGSVPGRPSLFTEVERPNFCQMRLDAVKSIGYDTRVRTFCEGIEELGESAAHCDYYATKMHNMVAGQKKDFPTEDRTTIEPCEQDYRRHLGNTAMPCITLKRVRLEAANDDDAAIFSFWGEDLDSGSIKPANQNTAGEAEAASSE